LIFLPLALVNRSIDLYEHSRSVTVEVNNEAGDDLLTAKVKLL